MVVYSLEVSSSLSLQESVVPPPASHVRRRITRSHVRPRQLRGDLLNGAVSFLFSSPSSSPRRCPPGGTPPGCRRQSKLPRFLPNRISKKTIPCPQFSGRPIRKTSTTSSRWKNTSSSSLRSGQATVCVQVGDSSGSGVIVSEDGIILTAAHVSGKPDQTITVIMPDGKRLKARRLAGTRKSIAA